MSDQPRRLGWVPMFRLRGLDDPARALRAEVERLTAERDEARALADGLTTALSEREQIEAALRERLARYERMIRDSDG